MDKVIKFFAGNSAARNYVLAAVAVVVGALLYASSDAVPFRIDWAAFAAVVWVAVRAGVGTVLAWLTRQKTS